MTPGAAQEQALKAIVRQTMRETVELLGPRRQWLSVADVCALTGVSRATVWEWMSEGLIPFSQIKEGGRRLIRADALDTFLSKHEARL